MWLICFLTGEMKVGVRSAGASSSSHKLCGMALLATTAIDLSVHSHTMAPIQKQGLLLYHFDGVCLLLHCAVALYAKREYLSL